MKKHTKIYLDAFGYDKTDFIPCEITGQPAVDIHHIEARGMGGSANKDRIENLMAVTREAHIKYGDAPQYMEFLYRTHLAFMVEHGVKFDMNYMTEKINCFKN